MLKVILPRLCEATACIIRSPDRRPSALCACEMSRFSEHGSDSRRFYRGRRFQRFFYGFSPVRFFALRMSMPSQVHVPPRHVLGLHRSGRFRASCCASSCGRCGFRSGGSPYGLGVDEAVLSGRSWSDTSAMRTRPKRVLQRCIIFSCEHVSHRWCFLSP